MAFDPERSMPQGRSPAIDTIPPGSEWMKARTGHCTYTVQFVPDNRGVATSKCQWQKP